MSGWSQRRERKNACNTVAHVEQSEGDEDGDGDGDTHLIPALSELHGHHAAGHVGVEVDG